MLWLADLNVDAPTYVIHSLGPLNAVLALLIGVKFIVARLMDPKASLCRVVSLTLAQALLFSIAATWYFTSHPDPEPVIGGPDFVSDLIGRWAGRPDMLRQGFNEFLAIACTMGAILDLLCASFVLQGSAIWKRLLWSFISVTVLAVTGAIATQHICSNIEAHIPKHVHRHEHDPTQWLRSPGLRGLIPISTPKDSSRLTRGSSSKLLCLRMQMDLLNVIVPAKS